MVGNKRCDYFFEFKNCPECNLQSDITARQCRGCNAELIDPNAKLTRNKPELHTLDVIEASYSTSYGVSNGISVVNISYTCKTGYVNEHYYTHTEKSRNIFYARFVRQHVEKASNYYMQLNNFPVVHQMLNDPNLKTPTQLICTRNEEGYYKIVKKVFAC